MIGECEKGKRYDTDELTFFAWNCDPPCGSEAAYSCWTYFLSDGEYLGPDEFGVAPLFDGVDDALLI